MGLCNRLLNESIKKSDLVVLFLSRESTESTWVQKEIDWALAIEKETNKPFIIPVVIEQCIIPNSMKDKIYFKLHSKSESDVHQLSLDLNKSIFQLVTRYGHTVENHRNKKM